MEHTIPCFVSPSPPFVIAYVAIVMIIEDCMHIVSYHAAVTSSGILSFLMKILHLLMIPYIKKGLIVMGLLEWTSFFVTFINASRIGTNNHLIIFHIDALSSLFYHFCFLFFLIFSTPSPFYFLTHPSLV